MYKSLVVVLALVGCGNPGSEAISAADMVTERLGAEAWADVSGNANGGAGYALAVGDLDLDGSADILAGAPGTSAPELREGTVTLYAGSATPTSTGTLDLDKANAAFGASIAIADFNGDGELDVLVGAPLYASGPAFTDEGAIALFLGTGLGGVAPIPAFVHVGGQAGALLGKSVASLGDVDGDGDDEIAAGSPGWDDGVEVDAGRVLTFDGGLVLGVPRVATMGVGGAMEGWAVAVAHDFLGDGREHLITGAPGGAGHVGIYGADDSIELARLGAPGTGQLGYSLASGHDLDGDGQDELVIGDPQTPDGGRVHVWSHAMGDAVYSSPWANARYGASVAIGDFEGDGLYDVLVGAPLASGIAAQEGAVHELRGYGDTYAMVDEWSQAGLAAGDAFGRAVAAGDVDGDGVDDGVFGARGHDALVPNGGRVSLHLGELDLAMLGVDLGTAGDYVILAKSAISTASASDVLGDVGLSPAAATFITGFSLMLDPSNEFSTSAQIDGQVFAADYAAPTPTILTTAVSDMELAFTDAAGRPADVTELGAGDIGGMTLAPGTYRWGTGLLVPTDVTLDGSPTDVWIFQVAQDLTYSSGVQVVLAGGALPENVYWQVSGKVVVGTTAHVEGIVMSQTGITFATGSSVDGRLLAQTAVTLDDTAVVAP